MCALINNIICPFCLTKIMFQKDVDICPYCKTNLPIEYVRRSEQSTPCFVQMVGWSSHGKSVYLQTLTSMIMRLSSIWRNTYIYSPQTNPTLTYTRQVREYLRTGVMPPATHMDIQEAYIMQLLGMERWGNRTIVVRDVAGESFNNLQYSVKYTPYLIHVPTVIMFFSLFDLKESNFSVDELMNGYIQTFFANDPSLQKKKRTAIITISKADLLLTELSSSISNYLISDPFSNLIQPAEMNENPAYVDMSQYVQNMHQISEEIKDWIDQSTSGHNLLMLARENNIQLKFSIVSSTGSPVPDDHKIKIGIRPLRVLDPLFWTLDLQSIP
ncbi:hypothetical protein SDC9_43874 [bioreactor metagenome]|uniref:Uncharacterized protein n=1 Tax=bioreactor metagenome TaxID=1076179 RepID=A0A644W4R3_9ZZZZ